jgi:TolB-like protein/tetratricopeptide (TPR) repeat protein
VHGDVKAQNVVREQGGRIVLMDFGAGRAQDAGPAGVAGTPMYLAPEVLAGEPPTRQSDLYSLGVLLFYLLTRAFPYTGVDIDSLRDAHADGGRRWLRDLRPDLPSDLVQALERAIEADPARRFKSAGAMEQALHPDTAPVAEVRPRKLVPIDTSDVTSRWPRFSFAMVAVALLAVVAGLVVWSRTNSTRGTVLSTIRTIGVLPMSGTSGSGIPADFAKGLTEELTSALGQVHALTVKSGSSLGAIEGKPDKEIARALDVDALLKATVSGSDGRDGDTPRLKVHARLFAAGTQAIVWSQEFNQQRGDSDALANDIAAAVTRAVQGTLTPAESARLTSRRQTTPQAEAAFLAGRAHIEGYGGASAEAALQSFQRALTLDSQHAGAHAGAARAYVTLGANGAIPNAQARAAALAAARRSLDLDPELAEAHAALGHIHFIYDWDWPGAEREFKRSLELNPNSSYALAYYANFLAAQGRFDESLLTATKARQLDPQSGDAIRNYALFLYYKRDYAAADRALLESAAIESKQVSLPLLRARIAEARGDFEGALADTRQALQLSRGAVVPLRVAEIRRAALSGRKVEALAILAALQREADTRKIRLSVRDLAYIELALGNKTKAIELFKEAVAEWDPTMVWLGVDPRVDALRDEPGFRQLLKTIGLAGVGQPQ